MLAVERKIARDVIGPLRARRQRTRIEGEPELAFELLRRVWRQGYATEASLAVLDFGEIVRVRTPVGASSPPRSILHTHRDHGEDDPFVECSQSACTAMSSRDRTVTDGL
ncbi:hypothetical protein ACFQZ8_03235 [Micromonospora azadirachtae]|uniref:Uncharacterized protein n=1 Tax=Micromonospora azadirachtae TaxID=1970735 RepID=A0ABW2ZWC2_9ACTN